jgi:hypothetical protein
MIDQLIVEPKETTEMVNTDTTELIIIKQLPEFEQSFIEANAEIQQRLAFMESIEVSPACPAGREETKSQAKKVKAELNKELAQFEERRKYVKKEINKPYEALERLYNEYVAAPYKSAISALTETIGWIEEQQIDEKTKETLEYFNEYRDSLGDDVAFMDFKRLNLKIGLSVSAKKLKEETRAQLDKIKADIDCRVKSSKKKMSPKCGKFTLM